MSNSLKNRLGLHGKVLKLTVKRKNTNVIVTKLVELTVKPREDQILVPFKVNPYLKKI